MAQQIKIKDPVEFRTAEGLKTGFVASINGKNAYVISPPETEFSVPLRTLRRREGVAPQRVFNRNLVERCAFNLNDEVYFWYSNNKIFGYINQLNPSRARVETDEGYWDVAYRLLSGDKTAKRIKHNTEKLMSRAELADAMLVQHKLYDWRFTFDNASKRAGSCIYEKQLITMSQQFCLMADDGDITDTLLHEIAHALVGPQHGHNSVWQAKAREIGCSAERTHCVNFSKPKYIVSCKRCKSYGVRDKRSRHQVCKRCRTPVTYEFYSEKLWNSYQR